MPRLNRTAASLGFSIVLIVLSVLMLERPRAGLTLTEVAIGTTPATLYQPDDMTGPIVIVAHGFAGSRQIMQAYSLHLAQAGYRVLAFDFEGHGRNPVPMSGDVTAIDGTTARLVAQTQDVIAWARGLPQSDRIALLGHSMATDVIARAGIASAQAGDPVDAVVGISMYSQAVTANLPSRLLMISGQWEGALRQAALDALHLVDPDAGEGDLAEASGVQRRAVVAPFVGHVGVLFSPTAVGFAQDWLADTFQRAPAPRPGYMGLWVLVLLAGIVLAFKPLSGLLPRGPRAAALSRTRFLAALILPSIVVPIVVAPFYQTFLPVLVADYLVVHLAAVGVLQLAILGGWRNLMPRAAAWPVVVLAVWGIFAFGLALDRYAASFWPTAERLPIIALLCLGTVPFLLADARLVEAGRAALWRRVLARLVAFGALMLAAFIEPDKLLFIFIVLPVFALFYLVHGLLGRWVAMRSGVVPAGLGLGLCLAWALGVSFPLFSAG